MDAIITELLQSALAVQNITDVVIEVENISHRHAGHFKGNGQSHFAVRVKSGELQKLRPLVRHRILNGAVAHLIENEQVHAISFEVAAE